jgi:undecaprenyl diphosphate synthase
LRMKDNDKTKTELPKHVGLILDGNRRWAKSNGLASLQGHKARYQNLKTIAKHALDFPDVQYLSAYVFSVENWNRTSEEVAYLMDMALWVATHEIKELHKENIRVRFLGSREGLSNKIITAIEKAETLTEDNTKGTVALCFNYGGLQELVDAAKQIIKKGISPEELTEKQLMNALYAPDVPPVDLLIRTSGEKRTSGFMLARSAYAELYFTNKHWPDFSVTDFDAALAEYQQRERRFGE